MLLAIAFSCSYLNLPTPHNHIKEEFNDKYIDVYLRVTEWLDKRLPLELKCNVFKDKLKVLELFMCDKLTITGHEQSEVANCLNGKKLLCFLIYLGKKSQWDVAKYLHLNPLFGLSFPLSELVFSNLLRRWNTFAPTEYHFPKIDWQGMTAAYNLKTKVIKLQKDEIGSVGWVRYKFKDDEQARIATILANFANFSGVGRKTALGMGRV